MSSMQRNKSVISKCLHGLLVMLMVLSPLISSAGPVLHLTLNDSAEEHVSSLAHESCHDANSDSVIVTPKTIEQENIAEDSLFQNNCCEDNCLCIQTGCNSTTALFYSVGLSIEVITNAVDYAFADYNSPLVKLLSPPPIS